MSNQASEDEPRNVLSDILTNLMIKSSLQKLDKHTDLITSGRKYIAMHNEELNTILALIRNEKLKLLAEVRERVVGKYETEYSNLDGDAGYWEKHGRNGMREKQIANLTKLEAEL